MRKRMMMLLASLALPLAVNAQSDIVMVVSGYGAGNGETRPGYEFDELAQAYLIFRDNGLTVDIASPQGGKVEADERDPEKPYNKRLLADAEAVKKLDNTLALDQLTGASYRAVFVVGGKGGTGFIPTFEQTAAHAGGQPVCA